MSKKEITFGIQECNKCKYYLRCEECVYSKQSVACIRKETAKEILQEVKECKGIKRLVELGYIISYINLCQEIDEIAEQFGVEVEK